MSIFHPFNNGFLFYFVVICSIMLFGILGSLGSIATIIACIFTIKSYYCGKNKKDSSNVDSNHTDEPDLHTGL